MKKMDKVKIMSKELTKCFHEQYGIPKNSEEFAEQVVEGWLIICDEFDVDTGVKR